MDDPAQRAAFIRDQLPKEGLFAGHEWRVATEPFSLKKGLTDELEKLGRVLLQFYRAANLLYRQSTSGKQPDWAADWLDLGKPSEIISRQRNGSFKNNLPAVFRPDILLTEEGWVITELDSVPGGMGLTAWLNHTYSDCGVEVIGGRNGMTDGFASIFENANNVHVVVSEESRTYRPEMKWICSILGDRFSVRDSSFTNWSQGDAVYRFFELFDLANVNNSGEIFNAAMSRELLITPPPKAFLEEKNASGVPVEPKPP